MNREDKDRHTPGQEPDLAKIPLPELIQRLGSSVGRPKPDRGPAAPRAIRLQRVPEEKANPLLKFLSYFWGPIPWMIEIAAILSAVVRHWADFWIIGVLLLVNAVVGFWEEFQAGNAIAALKKNLALVVRVKRSGSWADLPARELVPGDVIRLRLGDIVGADARLLDGDPIEVDQSALTGESLPVERKVGEGIYSGSIIRQGEVDALVYATGKATYFGKTAHLVETAHTVSHFQKAVLKIGDFLIVIAVLLVALILIVALFRGDPIFGNSGVCLDPDRGGHPRGDADGAVGDHGRCADSRPVRSHRQPAGGDRRAGRHGHPLRGQNRHVDAE